MVELAKVQAQLTKVGYRAQMWGRSEVRELCNVLALDETIVHAVNGHYEGGFALLVATDKRLILVDRKIMFLTLDAISYSMIQEVQLNYRLLNSTINIYTSNKCLVFNTWSHSRLRSILSYAQEKIMEDKMQHQNFGYNQSQPQPMIHEEVFSQSLPINYNPNDYEQVLEAARALNGQHQSSQEDLVDWPDGFPVDPANLSTTLPANPYTKNILSRGRVYTEKESS